MKKNLVSAMYVVNIVWQCIFTLVTPPAILALIAWLIVSKLSAPPWLYVPFITVGFLVGFVGMIRFAIAASEGLERLERSNDKRDGNQGGTQS